MMSFLSINNTTATTERSGEGRRKKRFKYPLCLGLERLRPSQQPLPDLTKTLMLIIINKLKRKISLLLVCSVLLVCHKSKILLRQSMHLQSKQDRRDVHSHKISLCLS